MGMESNGKWGTQVWRRESRDSGGWGPLRGSHLVPCLPHPDSFHHTVPRGPVSLNHPPPAADVTATTEIEIIAFNPSFYPSYL